MIPPSIRSLQLALRPAILACMFTAFVCPGQLFAQAAPAASPPAANTTTDNTGRLSDQAMLAPNTASEEAVTLSPFEVNDSRDTGYVANSTLAGTRLRTDLKDVAASVSVINKDFMNDIGANNLVTLLDYTLGSEVNSYGGNWFGGTTGSAGDLDNGIGIRETQPRVRLRGLSDADQTRDYFLTALPTDSYNTERVEINRGANSILFGLGSPAGIVNTSLIKANFVQDKTTYENQFDNYGSFRQTIDANQILLKDKLAVRFAALLGDQDFKQKPAYVRDRRYTLTFTAKPWAGATFHVTGETARQTSNKPDDRPPFDFITEWWEVGKPVFSVTNGVGSVALTGTPVNPLITANTVTSPWGYGTGINVILDNPNNPTIGQNVAVTGGSAYADGYLTSPQFNYNNTLRELGTGYPSYNAGLLAAIHQTNANPSLDPNFNYWLHPMLTDPSVFNFYDKLLEGPNKTEWAFWNTFNASFEQTLGKNAGVELAFDRQSLANGYIDPFNFTDGYGIFMDINKTLADGSPNPNFGRPYINNDSWETSGTDKRQTLRAQAYYNLDFKDILPGWLGKILGSHSLVGNVTDYTQNTSSYSGRPYVLGSDYVDATIAQGRLPSYETPDLAGGADFRMVFRTAYLGPSLINAPSAVGANVSNIKVPFNLDGLQSVSTQWYNQASNSYNVTNFSLIEDDPYNYSRTTTYGTATLDQTQITSKELVLSSHWWDDILVSTLGWRLDQFKFYSDDGVGSDYDPATGAGSGLALVGPRYQMLPSTPDLEGSKSTFSYGLVAHVPQAIVKFVPLNTQVSFFYNHSDNFEPTAQQYNILNQPLDAPTGKTKDFGILIQTLNGKLDLRITRYNSSIIDDRSLQTELQENINMLVRFPESLLGTISSQPYQALIAANPTLQTGVNAFNSWLSGPVGGVLANTFQYQFGTANGAPIIASYNGRNGNVTGINSSVSQGTEYELSFNPTRNWRITANASEQTAVLSAIDPALVKYVTDFDTSLKATSSLANLPIGPDPGSFTVGQAADQLQAGFNEILLDEGQSNPDISKWHFNLVTNYSWTSGALKGWNLGGAVRWEDEKVIGYGISTGINALGTYYYQDVNKRYVAPSESNYDGWIGYSRVIKFGWKPVVWNIQLNARNIGVGNKLIPVAANPDGSVGTWSIAEPMTVTLKNTFTF